MKTVSLLLAFLSAGLLSGRLAAAEPEVPESDSPPLPADAAPSVAEPEPPAGTSPTTLPPPALPPAFRARTNPVTVPQFPAFPTATNAPRQLPAAPAQSPAPRLAPQPTPLPGPPGAAPAAQPAFPPAATPPLPGGATLAESIPPAATNAPGVGADGKYAPGVLTLQMADLEVVLTLYAELTQRTVLRATSLPKVQVMLSNQTPWSAEEAVQALDTVLAMNGIAMVNVGDKFVSAVPANAVLQEGNAFARGEVKDLAETGQFVTKILKLKHVVPSEVQQIVGSFAKTPNGILAIDATQTLVLRDYPANVKRMSEMIEQIDVEVENDYKLEVIPIKYGKVEEIYNTMNSLIGGAGGGGAPSAAGAVARTTGMQRTPTRATRGGVGGMGGMGYGGYGGGYGGYGGYGTTPYRSGGYYPQDAVSKPLEAEIQEELASAGLYRPQQAATTPATPAVSRPVTTPGSAGATFNQRFAQILNRAGQQAGQVQLLQDARIVPDERSNSLIVFANKQDMKMITNIVAKVDRLMAQVVIDAIIMDVQLTDTYQLGVSWLMRPQTSSDGLTQTAASNNGNLVSAITNFTGGSGFTYLARYRDDLDVAVNALAAKNRGKILARPRIQTTHATPASFTVGETVPFVAGTYQGSSIYGPSSYFQQLNVDSTLDVTPFITPDGLVVMEVAQSISEISGFEEFPGVGKQPRTINRDAYSTISVRDRETVILGGYIRASKSKTSSGVPLLKDIPLLGTLFRSKSTDNKRSELIILIRPTILRTPEEAAEEAENERNRLPGIRDMQEDTEYKEESTGERLKTMFGK